MTENYYELNNFESLQIGLASTDKILSWSRGEVTEPETINYRTLKPEPNGLFCEKIFGPQKDWECHCGKYKKIRYKGIVCDKCGVEVTKAKVRRERMGHIKLAAPVSHIWYFKGIPSRMGLVLDMTPRNLEKILYFAAYVVLEPGDSGFDYKELINEQQYAETKKTHGDTFKAGIGADAVRQLMTHIDLVEMSAELREALKKATGQKKIRIVRRLEVIEALRLSGNKPEWMILEVIPVIPPDIRPMVQLDGGRFATSDLNDLYRRVINRNNRLSRLLELGAPDIIVRNEKRMLQEAVDALIDNGRRGRPVTGPGSRPLKSLSDMLKGKQGRFRQNLLGKRVDYSGRSVIVVGPELRFWQCGLPKKMALELFKPFIMKKLVENGDAHNIKSAKRMVEKVRPEVWDVLEDIIQEHPVLLNRAPTLHRLGIQAFEPVLVEGKAIKLHPLVCTAFNADFDGDQMAVHVPLSMEAQAEARFLMLSVNNILAPKDGAPITTPTQDMILGSYYLTHEGTVDRSTAADKGDGKIFADINEMLMAYENKEVGLHAKVKVKRLFGPNDVRGKLVESTVGRFIFNQQIPQDLGFVEDRKSDPYSLEVDFLCDKKRLGHIIDRCYRIHGNTGTALMLDYIKDIGFHYSTIGAITISISDMEIPKEKQMILEASEAKVAKYEDAYNRGLVSGTERYEKVIEIWNKTTDDVANALMDSLGTLNNLYIMAHSGARGSKNQIRQIGGMRGLMANATGKTIEIPIKANFREGLSVLEYFISTNGARKGLADTALRTADSGYLTRRLVDVSHNVIVRDVDCGTGEGIEVRAFTDGKEVIEPLKLRIIGRISLTDILHPKTGEVICEQNQEITEDIADMVEKAEITSVAIRSVMTCQSKTGICAMCYGRNLANGERVNIGESVGITAAQSIGEPGTQLTMRTFHTGGVAGADITHGLPRVEELFEARKPKGLAEICESSGTVYSITQDKDNKTEVIIRGDEERSYIVSFGARLAVEQGDYVEAGDNITKGPLNPHDILRLKGVEGVYQYLLKEVQRVYKLQGVDINDKHVEVIVSQMLGKYKIEECGDTTLLPGGLYTKFEIEDAQKELQEKYEAEKTKLRNALEGYLSDKEGLTAELQGIQKKHENSKAEVDDSRRKVTEKELALSELLEAKESPTKYKEFLKRHPEFNEDKLNANIATKEQEIESLKASLEKLEVKISQKKEDENKSLGAAIASLDEKIGKTTHDLENLKPGEPAVVQQVLLGITKASLATNSFLSAASFQETTRVLTDAAIKGKNDKLLGLKENVIIGKLIPAGTGMKRYRNIKVDYGVNTELMENYKLNNDYEDEFEGSAEQVSLAESDFEVRVSDDGIEIIRDNSEN